MSNNKLKIDAPIYFKNKQSKFGMNQDNENLSKEKSFQYKASLISGNVYITRLRLNNFDKLPKKIVQFQHLEEFHLKNYQNSNLPDMVSELKSRFLFIRYHLIHQDFPLANTEK